MVLPPPMFFCAWWVRPSGGRGGNSGTFGFPADGHTSFLLQWGISKLGARYTGALSSPNTIAARRRGLGDAPI
eukprot:1028583-Heterocapsa_arctica.AAC.1